MSLPVAAKVDPAFEFDCPQYRDFEQADDEQADIWFAQSGKPSDANDLPSEFTADVLAAASSTLTAPIHSLALEAEQEKEQEVTAVYQVNTSAAEPAQASTNLSATLDNVALEHASEMEVDAPVVLDISAAADEGNTSAAVESPVDSEIAAITQSVPSADVDASANASVNASVNASLNLSSSSMTDELIQPTGDASFSASNDDESMMTRGSMVFTQTQKRFSLPTMNEAAEIATPIAEAAHVEATTPDAAAVTEATHTEAATPVAAAAAHHAHRKSVEIEAAAAQTDMEVEAFQTSLFVAPATTEELAVAALDAEIPAHQEEEEAVEVEEEPKLSIMEQLAEAADDSADAVEEFELLAPLTAPSTQRKQSLAASKSIPSFLRPTAAALAKAQEKKVAPPSTTKAHITARRGVTAAAVQALAMAAAATPKPRKRPASSIWDELSRPKTASKKPQDTPSTSSVAAPASSRKQSMHAGAHGASMPKLTIAHSPALSTKARAKLHHGAQLLSTEEAELAQIATERELVKKEMQATTKAWAEHDHEHAAPSMPVRAGQLTQPEEFSFQTAKRAKVTSEPAASPVKQHHVQHHVAGEVTKVQPFHLSTSSRTRPTKSAPLSQAEQDELLMSAMPKFKALPLKKEIFQAGGECHGVPRVQKAKLTEATSPNLATKDRVAKRKQEEGEQEAAAAATVKDAPKSAKKQKKEEHEHDAATATGAPKSARKIPRPAAPFHLATEERGKHAQEEFERRRAAEDAVAKQKREFHARPLTGSVEPMTARPATAAATPMCVERSREARQRIEEKQRLQLEAEKKAHEFKALRNPSAGHAHQQPTTIEKDLDSKKSLAPLTTPIEMHLASEARAIDRAAFDAQRAKMEAEAAVALEAKKASDALEAKKAEAVLRKGLVLRAHPVPNFDPAHTFHPKPSEKKLTEPESPMLITKRRAQRVGHELVQLAEEEADVQQENIMPIAIESMEDVAVETIV